MDSELDSTVVATTLSPLIASFDKSALESLVRFRAGEKTQDRFEHLAEKSSDGTLTPDEQREYESIVRTSSFIAVLQAQAEGFLTENRNAEP